MRKFLSHLKSVLDYNTESTMKSKLNKLGFNVQSKDAIRQEIKRLDSEVLDVINDDDAYWANRQACWNLTSLLLGEVK